MPSWPEAFKRGLISGSVASLSSTLVLALMGRRRSGSATAPTNATSHWIWGDRAGHVDGVDGRHTGLSYLIHHASAVFWAVLYERYRSAPAPKLRTLRDAGATAALASFVDYRLTPRRLTPGFELRLPGAALAAIFAALALGLSARDLRNRP